MTCMGRSEALPIPLLPLLYEAYCMANIECSINQNDDVILTLAPPVIACYIALEVTM